MYGQDRRGMVIRHVYWNTLVVAFCLSYAQCEMNEDAECDANIPSRPGFSPKFSDVSPPCGEGEYHDMVKCSPCQDGTFMTHRMAREMKHSACVKCLEPNESLHEIVGEQCTRTRDTKIMCEDEYYRSEVPGKPCQSECRRCDVCGLGSYMFMNYEVRKCGGYQNRVCCHNCESGNLTSATYPPSSSTTSEDDGQIRQLFNSGVKLSLALTSIIEGIFLVKLINNFVILV
ncbi:unnamed protein product [Lymnaea stagnalis]|uniref:TNFR-Cys domain-containing protein n=1 Tax=Lymnaea stagnalis TaxID=6523 RepID=A0AAV2HIH4_LYMST